MNSPFPRLDWAIACCWVLGGITALAIGHATLANDLGWPRAATSSGGVRVFVSMPDVLQWTREHVEVRCAVETQLKGSTRRAVGTVTLRARAALDRAERVVRLDRISVPAMRFPYDESEMAPVRDALGEIFAHAPMPVRLDDLTAPMTPDLYPVCTDTLPAAAITSIRVVTRDPGQVKQGESPADSTRVEIAAKPEFVEVIAGQLEGARNCTVPLFRMHDGALLLLASGRWFTADSIDAGTWASLPTSQVPQALKAIPLNSRWAAALANVPGTLANLQACLSFAMADSRTYSPSAKATVTWHKPLTAIPIDGTTIEYCAGSDAATVRIAGEYFALVAGAWFSGKPELSEWSICPKVPELIESIPADSGFAFLRDVTLVDSSPESLTYYSTNTARNTFMQGGVLAYGSGAIVRQDAEAWMIPPAPTFDASVWWNPWTLEFFHEDCSQYKQHAPSSGGPGEQVASGLELRCDRSEENLFVGHDGRVYALRGESWFRSASDGSWVELLEKRSTLRVLESSFVALQGAQAMQSSYEQWCAHAGAFATAPGTQQCDWIRVMDENWPQYPGYRALGNQSGDR